MFYVVPSTFMVLYRLHFMITKHYSTRSLKTVSIDFYLFTSVQKIIFNKYFYEVFVNV